MPPKESESLKFIKIGEAISQGDPLQPQPTVPARRSRRGPRLGRSKKKRTRKKNLHRLLKKYEKEKGQAAALEALSLR